VYYITPEFYSLSEKVVAALIVTGECKTIAKQWQYIPLNIFPPSYSPRLSPPKNNYNITLKCENKCISFKESTVKREV